MIIHRRNVLKSAAAIALAGSSSPGKAFALPIRQRNWARNVEWRPSFTRRPRTLSSLQEIISKSTKVRAIGSKHSFNTSMATDATLILTDKLDRILDTDTERMQITVEAGRKLKDLHQPLEELGWTLPSLGDIDEQSLAGLISTGTHGTGLQWGSFSDQETLVRLQIVTADGDVVSIESGRELEAARLCLGALGFVYSVTLQCVPARNEEYTSRIANIQEGLTGKGYETSDHFEFFHFPFTEDIQIITRDITDKPSNYNAFERDASAIFVENILLDILTRSASLIPQSTRVLQELVAALAGGENYVGRSYEVQTKPRIVRFYEMEYCFPVDRLGDVYAVYSDLNNYFYDKEIFFANFPSEVRFLRGDRGNMLSPTLGQDSCYFAVQSHPKFGPRYEDYFRAMEQEFIALGGCPHWGKIFYENPLERYETANEFMRIVDTFDPQQKFRNAFLDRLLTGENL